MLRLSKIEEVAKRLIAEVKELPVDGVKCFCCDKETDKRNNAYCRRCGKSDLAECERCVAKRPFCAELCVDCRTCGTCSKPIDSVPLITVGDFQNSGYRYSFSNGAYKLYCKDCPIK
jgi:hypothetical protein